MGNRTELHWGEQQDKIRALLMGHTVVRVDNATLQLDDGTVLNVRGNDGCGGCTEGWYDITELNGCPTNAVMAVEFDDEWKDQYDWKNGERPHKVQMFVLAADERIGMITAEGSDNGYYGTGFWIEIEAPEVH